MSTCDPTRRNFFQGLAALFLSGAAARSDVNRPANVIVAFVSGVDAYADAVRGLATGLSKFAVPLFIDLKAPRGEAALADALTAGQQHLVIAVGSEGLAALTTHKVDEMLICTMILRADRPRGPQSGSQRPPAVYLDLPLPSLAAELKNVMPGKNRLGLIRNPARFESDPSINARIRQHGFTLETATCARPEDLVKAFLSLKDKTDFVVVLPDSSLYNNTTVRPLILASLESRLPIVGFSSSFVRAGAAVAVYPDFQDVGSQTADLVQKLLSGRTGMADETPRKIQVAVNQRVLRLLGLNCRETPGLIVYR